MTKYIENIEGILTNGHYSQLACLPNGLIIISGQKSWDENGNVVGADIVEQTHKIFDNLEIILSDQGLNLDSIVRINCHLSNIRDYIDFNSVYSKRLSQHKPTRCVLGGYELRDNALIELVVEAYKD